MTRLHPTLRNLVTNESGNIAITFGLTTLMAVAFVGGAVDFGRAYQQKSRMQNALDAAVVSAVARYRESSDWTSAEATAINTFKSIFSNAVQPTANNPTPAVAMDQPLVSFTRSGNQVSGAVRMTTNTPFLKMVAGHDLSVGATSNAVPPDGRKLEIALMVDLTGSMGWDAAAPSTTMPCGTVANPNTKIDYLRCAGEDLVNILLPSSGANDASVRVGVAPFADKVNAGTYASAVTGLPATGGTFSNIQNLASTKQGPWTGSYSGPNSGGSQFGATGAVVPSGGTSAAGATYSNGYCAVPTVTSVQSIAVRTDNNNYRIGVEVDRDYDYDWNPSAQVAGVITLGNNASSSEGFRKVSSVDGDGTQWLQFINLASGTDNKGYFVPLPVSTTGLTTRTRTAWSDGSNRTGNIGVGVSIEEDNTISSSDAANLQSIGMIKATSSAGYWKLTYIASNGTPTYSWRTSGWYVPLYETLTTSTTTTVVGCEHQVVAQPSSQLISCVTERKNGSDLDYSADAVASGRYIGPYNHGSSSTSNYSSDGKCWSAGRELAPVIPLTNDRATLNTFFSTAKVGGATAGHLGTAWASYLLSPVWSGIWPSASMPTAYNSSNVTKAAILMTDGEYNIQYSMGGVSTNVSGKQALMLCKEMRSQGIKVYTIGFGFEANATPPNPNIQAMSDSQRTTPLTGSQYSTQVKALDTLAKCASDNSSYYFPYDGGELRNVFKNIANSLSAELNGGSSRIIN